MMLQKDNNFRVEIAHFRAKIEDQSFFFSMERAKNKRNLNLNVKQNKG